MNGFCECLNIEAWPELKGFLSKGSREKKWVIRPIETGKPVILEIFLFKQSHRRYDIEFWSEIIASEIAKIIGIPSPKALCARDGDKYGILLKFFLKLVDNHAVQELREGGDLISAVDPSFDRKKGEKHNIHLIEQVFKHYKKDIIFNIFLKLLVFDAIIGNTDRHQENWGVILDHEAKTVTLAPAYDNSDCFGREILEADIESFLKDDKKLNRYLLRGEPHISWSDDGIVLKKLNHIDFLKQMVGKWPFVSNYIKELTTFSDQVVTEMLAKLFSIEIRNPRYKISDKRGEFIKKIIIGRRDLIKREFGLI